MINELKLFENIFLVPIFRINVTVKISELNKTSLLTKSISNWEIIEKLRKLSPKTLVEDVAFKVHKSTTEFLSFSADLKSRIDLKQTIANLDKKRIKLNGFAEQLLVDAVEERNDYPRNHDWNSYFRDTTTENEPGLRPDTVIVHNLPIIWFYRGEKNILDEIVPSKVYVKQVFETFGEVRAIDIPMLDPIQNFSLLSKIDHLKKSDANKICDYIKANVESSEKIFESIIKASTLLKFSVYIQYKNILGFTKAIDSLRGSRLIFKESAYVSEKISYADIKIDFDRTSHLSDKNCKRRALCSERLKSIIKKRESLLNEEMIKEKNNLDQLKVAQMEEEQILNETKSRIQIESETLKCLERKKKLQKIASKECKRERKVLSKQLKLYQDYHEDRESEIKKILRLQRRICRIISTVDSRREEIRIEELKKRELKRKFEEELKKKTNSPLPDSDLQSRVLSRLEERMRNKLIQKKLASIKG